MSFLGGQKTHANQTPAVSGLQLQTSAYGKVVPIVFGTNKVAPNLLWYGDFTAIAQQSAGAGGGKGGVGGGGGGKGGGGSVTYMYSVSVIFGLCEGPVADVGTVWANKNQSTVEGLGMSLFLGTYPQDAWGYLVQNRGGTSKAFKIPTTAPYQIRVADDDQFIFDGGVYGQPAHAVFQRVYTAPAAGQYLMQPLGGSGSSAQTLRYTFSAADKGKSVLVSYYSEYGTIKTDRVSIPTTAPYQAIFYSLSKFGQNADQGVVQANIGYLPAAGAPAIDEYQRVGGLYTFNAANAGANITITYAAMGTGNFEALSYPGIAYAAIANYQLGTSPQLGNHNFEVFGIHSDSVGGRVDADPSMVLTELLTNEKFGAGFPAATDFSLYQSYALASNLLISPAYTEQNQCATLLTDIAAATNSEFVWSNNTLTLVPYCAQSVTGNGVTYTPPTAPLFDLDDDDFIAADGEDPVKITRKRVDDSFNSIKIEFLNRENQYNAEVAEAKDQASIEEYGLRQSKATDAHLFADPTCANVAVQLMLQRQAVQNKYEFTLDQRYIVLDPMDIVTIPFGSVRQWVRIKEITEDEDGNLLIEAEEVLDGTGVPAEYTFETSAGFQTNYNTPADSVNAPVIFEPTAQLAEKLEVWIAASGGQNWGGCDVYISTDDKTYQLAGRINGTSRQGVLSSALPTIAEAPVGLTIDTTNTLSVDLSASRGQLLSGTQQDALNFSTLCYVDGEYIAYQTATLTDPNQYDLTYLVRGALGTSPSTHDAGAQFARIDDTLFAYPFTPDRIGQTIYIKLVSFNIYGSGEQNIADVSPYSYVIKGTAYSSPLPPVDNLRLVFNADIAQLVWDEIEDFRPVLYEIRKGATFDTAQSLGRFAHPPFNLLGDDTYWVVGYSQPVSGLQVYSESPASITVIGTSIQQNIIATWDEKATGWTGTLGGTAAVIDGDVVTGPAGDILGVSDILSEPDVLTYGGMGDGTYEIPAAHQIDIGRVAPCMVIINWRSFGQLTTENILDDADVLTENDVLNFQSTALTDVYPEIALSLDGVTYGDWQKYVAGVYNFRKIKIQMQLKTFDPQVRAYLDEFSFSVDVPDRTDHYVGQAIDPAGTAIVFSPDNDRGTPTPFNGGPPESPSVPAVSITIWDADAGDTAKITSQTLSGCTIQVLNSSGVGIAKTVTIIARGY